MSFLPFKILKPDQHKSIGTSMETVHFLSTQNNMCEQTYCERVKDKLDQCGTGLDIFLLGEWRCSLSAGRMKDRLYLHCPAVRTPPQTWPSLHRSAASPTASHWTSFHIYNQMQDVLELWHFHSWLCSLNLRETKRAAGLDRWRNVHQIQQRQSKPRLSLVTVTTQSKA